MGSVTILTEGQICPNPNCGQNNHLTTLICPKCQTEQKQLLGKGTLLNGRYRIEAVLGSGGFGAVYQATDLLTGQIVAIKENRQYRTFTMFAQEASLLLTLHHPHLPRVHESFLDQLTGKAYLVMDFVEGETLEKIVKRFGRLSWDEAKDLFEHLFHAIAYMHERGIVHRDIKPSNIIVVKSANNFFSVPDLNSLRHQIHSKQFRQAQKLLQRLVKGELFGEGFVSLQKGSNRLAGIWSDETSGQKWHLWVRFSGSKIVEKWCDCPEGKSKKFCPHLLALLGLYLEQPNAFNIVNDSPLPPVALVDFGIAKVMESTNPLRPHSTSMIAWTEGFSPPEQYQSSTKADTKTDQYLLAATLLFSLTGEIPEDAITRLERFRKGKSTLPAKPTGVPDFIWKAISKALSLDPKDRFASVSDFWEAINGQRQEQRIFIPQIQISEPIKAFVSKFWHKIPFLTPTYVLSGHSDTVSALAFSPDGQILASGSFDRTVRFWLHFESKQVRTLRGHEDSVLAIAFSTDGKKLGSASADKTVKIWQCDNENAVITLHSHNEAVLTIASSPEGGVFATGCADGCIRVFSWQNGQLLWRSEPLGAFVNTVAFSPDGKLIIFGCADGVVGLLSVKDGKRVRQLCEIGLSISCLSLSSDGHYFALGVEGLGIQIWELTKGRVVRTFNPFSTKAQVWVNSVAFSPNGQLLAVGGMDEVVRIFRLESGKFVKTLKGHKGWVTAVAFSHDGKWLASGSTDRTVRLWQLG